MGSVAIVLSAIATPSQIMRECLEAFSCAIRRHASTCPFRMCPLDISGPFSSALLSVLMLMRCVTPGCTEGASPLFCYASAPRDTASRYARNTDAPSVHGHGSMRRVSSGWISRHCVPRATGSPRPGSARLAINYRLTAHRSKAMGHGMAHAPPSLARTGSRQGGCHPCGSNEVAQLELILLSILLCGS